MLHFLFSSTPLIFFVQSFWRDEAFSYLLAKKNIFQILSLTAKDFNPPLYYLLLHFWMKFFGSSEIALRSLSLIFFWATIYVIFLFLTKILKVKSSFFTLCYLLFAILNPLLLYYAFEARMYTMFAFFTTLSFYSLYKKKQKLFFLSTLLSLYTHYFTILALFTQLILIAYLHHDRGLATKKKLLKSLIFSFLAFLPWLIFVFFEKSGLWEAFWLEKMNLRFFVSFLAVVYSGYEYNFKFFDKFLLKTSLFFVFLIILGLLKTHHEKIVQKKLFYFLFVWGVMVPITVGGISFLKPIFLPRYLIFSTIGFLLLVILIVERLPTFFRIIILITVFIITINYHQLQLKHRKKADLRKIIKEIKYLSKKDDVLYVTDELDFHTAQYYFDENRVYIYGKTHEEIPNYVGKILIPREKIINKLPLYPKKAFLLTSDSHYDIISAF